MGLIGGVVYFIAGIKDEYNKIAFIHAFIDLQNNNIVFIWCTNVQMYQFSTLK